MARLKHFPDERVYCQIGLLEENGLSQSSQQWVKTQKQDDYVPLSKGEPNRGRVCSISQILSMWVSVKTSSESHIAMLSEQQQFVMKNRDKKWAFFVPVF